ncbi:hypothetical protein ABZT02_44965 [Streptomyces sp. NPDC005402]|uniref:hypothetical protein n=1 Tax=Streptomyces sp. NPDC005402 TaxID=3155338 RepID=UPI0033ABFA93
MPTDRDAFLARAKAYAHRHPDDQQQAAIVASLDPAWTPPVVIPPGRTLDLTAARARRGLPAPVAAAAPGPSSPVRRHPLNVGAARAKQAAAEAARRPPLAPAGALRFVAGGSWRWAHVDSMLPSARSWVRLAADLTAAGPLHSLSIRRGEAVGHGGHAQFHHGDGGTVWASVVIDPAVCGSSQRTERVIAHELAHVGDELAKLATVTAAAWWRGFSDPHRTTEAEAFAVAAEDWLTTRTTAAEIIAAARKHQAGRRVR